MNTQIAEYSQTEAALNELKSRWGEVPDATTKEGYELVKSGISEVRWFRTSLEKMRVELKAPILERGKLLDSEAKRITAELVAIETPMAAAKKAVDDREAREKAERIARLQAKVDELSAIPASMKGKSSNEIAEAIESLDAIDTTEDYYDLTTEAIHAQRDSLTELRGMLMERLGFEAEQVRQKEQAEKMAQQQAEIDAAQAEVEEARKIMAEAAMVKQAQEEKENNERIAKEAAERAIVEAEEKAIIAAELAEKQQAEAVEAERQKIEAERLAEEDAAKGRAANKANCKKINDKAVKDLIKNATDLDEPHAKQIVEAIAKGLISNISIKY